MADVTINYNGIKIAELSNSGGGTIHVKDKFCEGDIEVAYAPNSMTYDITLPKTYNWILLTTLDADVLEHINDENLIVSLVNLTPTLSVYYSGCLFIAMNKVIGNYNGVDIYGTSVRRYSATNSAFNGNTRPANNTDSSEDNLTFGNFKIIDGKYYVRPGDGYIDAGTYRLTFTW